MMMKKCALVALMASLFYSSLFAISPSDVDFAPTVYVQHFQINTAVSLVIGFDPANVTTTDWSYCVAAACAPMGTFVSGTQTLGNGLQFSFSNTTVTIIGTSNVEAEYDFTLRANNVILAGGAAATRSYHIVVRKPRSMVFLLDRSGSMECRPAAATASTDWPNCINDGDKRWNFLKAAMNIFVKKIEPLHTLSDDRMSVVYFSGSTTNGTITTDATPFVPILNYRGTPVAPNDPTPIKTEMESVPIWNTNPRLGRDGTSIGAAMDKGFQRFTQDPIANNRKILFLFSDGQQNTGRWVVETGGRIGEIIQDGETISTHPFDTDSPTIEIYSTAMVFSPISTTLMENIASDAAGHYLNVMAGAENVVAEQISSQAYNKLYDEFSPQFIGFEPLILNYNQTVSASFQCNKNVNRVILETYFEQAVGKSVRYKIFKDGVDVTNLGTPLSKDDYVHSIIFNMFKIQNLKSEGKWTVELYPGSDNISNSKARIFATADDHQIKFKAKLSQLKTRVGDAMHPQVTLFENGKAITNATVKAVILKPGDDIGDILARTQANNIPTPVGMEYANCGDLKYDYLQATNPAALLKLKTISQSTVLLSHQGKGFYTGTFSNVDVSGTYKVRYYVSYNSPALGQVERMIEHTINVTFPEVKWQLSMPKPLPPSDGGHIRNYEVTIRPSFEVNGKNRYVGPGFENAYSLSNSNDVKLNNVKDNCDGSYTLKLNGDLTKRINILLTDKVIYSGRAVDVITGVRGFALSVHGGITLPTGTFKNIVNTGVYAEGDLAYRFNKNFSIEAIGGYYAFRPNYTVIGGNLCAFGHLPIQNDWEASFGVGLGAYKPNSLTAESGNTVRLNVSKTFKQRFVLSFDAANHAVKNYSINYLTLGLGFKFYL